MHLKYQRFFVFLAIASLFSAFAYLYIFTPSYSKSTLEHFSLPKWPTKPEKYAYATFLGPPTSTSNIGESTITNSTQLLEDPYFICVRLLNYQIKHAEKTRTRLEGVPFLVLVLPTVPKAQVAVLQAEGATVVPIKPLDLPDAFDREFIEKSRFRDVLSKLRLWTLTNYQRVVYLDADSFLLERLDELFVDPEMSVVQKTLPMNSSESDDRKEKGVVEPPSTYLMAASSDTYGDQTEWEEPGHVNYLCACFMLFAPSLEMFSYYVSVLNSPEAPQNAAYPEQDLLIWVHRKPEEGGRMPWRRIPVQWSANDGEMHDEYALRGGVKSLHVKGWNSAEGGNVASEKFKGVWRDLVRDMEDYWHKKRIWEEPDR